MTHGRKRLLDDACGGDGYTGLAVIMHILGSFFPSLLLLGALQCLWTDWAKEEGTVHIQVNLLLLYDLWQPFRILLHRNLRESGKEGPLLMLVMY